MKKSTTLFSSPFLQCNSAIWYFWFGTQSVKPFRHYRTTYKLGAGHLVFTIASLRFQLYLGCILSETPCMFILEIHIAVTFEYFERFLGHTFIASCKLTELPWKIDEEK